MIVGRPPFCFAGFVAGAQAALVVFMRLNFPLQAETELQRLDAETKRLKQEGKDQRRRLEAQLATELQARREAESHVSFCPSSSHKSFFVYHILPPSLVFFSFAFHVVWTSNFSVTK